MSLKESFRGLKRESVNLIYKSLFPIEVQDSRRLLPRLYALLNEGYGFLFVINHEKESDVFNIMNMIFSDKHLNQKEFVSAMAWHRYYHKNLAVRLLTRLGIKLGDVKTQPVVTHHTIQIAQQRGIKVPPLNYGYDKFAGSAITVIGAGGMAGLAPQSEISDLQQLVEEMQSSPNKKRSPGMGTFLATTDHKKLDKVAILFLGIQSTSDKKLPIGVRHTINVGNVLTKQELMDLARISGKNPNPYRAADLLTSEYLNELAHGQSNYITDLI